MARNNIKGLPVIKINNINSVTFIETLSQMFKNFQFLRHERPLVNPCWCSVIVLLESKKLIICSLTIDSSTLQTVRLKRLVCSVVSILRMRHRKYNKKQTGPNGNVLCITCAFVALLSPARKGGSFMRGCCPRLSVCLSVCRLKRNYRKAFFSKLSNLEIRTNSYE